jgi:hypothetical protein
MILHRFSSQLVRRLPNKSSLSQMAKVSSVLGENLCTVAGYSYETPKVDQKSSGRAYSVHAKYPPFDRNSAKGEFGAYAEDYDQSLKDPEGFWGDAAKDIHWFESPTQVLSQDAEKPYLYQWFSDGVTNTAYNCLDVHVNAGHGDRTAVIYDSPVTGVKTYISFKELLDQVSVFAGALKDELGVEPGDRVIIYMPMIPEAIVSMVRMHKNVSKADYGSVEEIESLIFSFCLFFNRSFLVGLCKDWGCPLGSFWWIRIN